jgi:hypothetical protein
MSSSLSSNAYTETHPKPSADDHPGGQKCVFDPTPISHLALLEQTMYMYTGKPTRHQKKGVDTTNGKVCDRIAAKRVAPRPTSCLLLGSLNSAPPKYEPWNNAHPCLPAKRGHGGQRQVGQAGVKEEFERSIRGQKRPCCSSCCCFTLPASAMVGGMFPLNCSRFLIEALDFVMISKTEIPGVFPKRKD